MRRESASRAHPRTRGRDDDASGSRRDRGGSPPHAGKGRTHPKAHTPRRGLTPARGEGTSRCWPLVAMSGAHPRTRGRDSRPSTRSRRSRGSPPHAGKGPANVRRRLADPGLTPARGEGTPRAMSVCARSRAHPRTRGRDERVYPPHAALPGSPPHAGKGRQIGAQSCADEGLTPARGEGTPTGTHRSRSAWAHPRTRGRDVC